LLAILILSSLEEEFEKIEEEVVDAVAMDGEVLAFVVVFGVSWAGGLGGVGVVGVLVVELGEPIMMSVSPFGFVGGSVDVRSLVGVSLLVLSLCGCVRLVTVFVFLFFGAFFGVVFGKFFIRFSSSLLSTLLTSLLYSLLDLEKTEESDESVRLKGSFRSPFFVLRMLELSFLLPLRRVSDSEIELLIDVEESSQSVSLVVSWLEVVRPVALSL
jgi:hypothetical protein